MAHTGMYYFHSYLSARCACVRKILADQLCEVCRLSALTYIGGSIFRFLAIVSVGGQRVRKDEAEGRRGGLGRHRQAGPQDQPGEAERRSGACNCGADVELLIFL